MTRIKHHDLGTGSTSTVKVFDLPVLDHTAELKRASAFLAMLLEQDHGTDDVYYISEG